MATVTSVLEDLLDDCRDYVEGNFSTYLTAMGILKADGVNLEDIKKHVIGDTNAFKENVSPLAFYFPMEIRYEPLDLTEEELKLQLYISFSFDGTDSAELTKKAMRYVDCFRKMIVDDHTMGSAVDYARVSDAKYFATDPNEGSAMLIEIILDVTKTVAS
jgi:hypothetical protein